MLLVIRLYIYPYAILLTHKKNQDCYAIPPFYSALTYAARVRYINAMTTYSGKNSYRVIRRKLTALLLLSTSFLAYSYASGRPELTEEYYSRLLYPMVISKWNGFTSLFSFSIAEFIVYAIALLVIVRIVRGVAWFIQEQTGEGRMFYFLDLVLSGAVLFASICFLFIALWGFNYNRLPFAETSGLDVSPVPVRTLERGCMQLAEQTNGLRGFVREDDDGVMALSVPLRNTMLRAGEGYRAAATEFETLGDFKY